MAELTPRTQLAHPRGMIVKVHRMLRLGVYTARQCRSTSAAAGCGRRDDGRRYLSLPRDALSAAFPPVAFRDW